jgi:hypothetical protein
MYDIFSNPKLKAILTLYVIMMGFDLFGRIMIPEPQTAVPATTAAADEATSTLNSTSIPAEDVPINGDAIPINRDGFGDLKESKSRIRLIQKEAATSKMLESMYLYASDVSTTRPSISSKSS